MADVAREAGVSRQLVSLVIRDTGYVAPEKRKLVLEAAERLGYRRNNLAASLAGRRSYSIGLVVLDIHNQVYADIADGVSDVLRPAGYQLLLATGAHRDDSGKSGLESLVGLRVDGVLVGTHLPEATELSRMLAGTPAVVVGESAKIAGVDAVRGDGELGIQMATEHLVAQGHRRIAFIGGHAFQQNTDRRAGYRAVMERHGLEFCEEQSDASEAAGEQAFGRLMRASGSRPTGVVCYNDTIAIGVLAGARRAGLRVPEDLAVIGYDDTRAAAYPGVELTSVDQGTRNLGAQAARLLLERIEHPSREAACEVFAPKLVVRASSQFQRN